ncbi:MAG: aspartate carbamoyltransferase regulatory subunit [Vibrionaceae bacterium]
MNNQRQLTVEAIENGTVIDHIPAGVGLQVMQLFQQHMLSHRLVLALNLPSHLLGKKDIIKIENMFLVPKQAQLLALLAPNATINCIKQCRLVEKITPSLPSTIHGLFICPNSNCITHDEKSVASDFLLIEKGHELAFKCHFCEKLFSREIMRWDPDLAHHNEVFKNNEKDFA